jgi:hypothetical protein
MSLTLLVFMLFFVMMATRGGRHGRRPDALEATTTRRELEELRRAVDDLSSRFHRLETERDFYRELLGPPAPEEAAHAESADTDAGSSEGSPLTRP